MRLCKFIFILLMLLPISACNTYYVCYGDCDDYEKERITNSMLKDALKIAKKYGNCFYLNASLEDKLPLGWVWYYVQNGPTNKLYIKHYTKNGIDERTITYDKSTSWLNRYNENNNNGYLLLYVYGGYLDGPTMYFINRCDNRWLCNILTEDFNGIIENPGMDTFFDNLVEDIIKYDIIPEDWRS